MEETHGTHIIPPGLGVLLGRTVYPYLPYYIARRQRNIENNRDGMYEDMASSPGTKVTVSTSAPSSSPSSSLESLGPPVNILTKEKYLNIVKSRRQAFVHAHFGNVLNELYTTLEADALSSKVCHREVTFELPEHFDIDKAERMLSDYFADIGFKAMVEGRKENTGRIIITIT
jgi:hypothetical protein